MSSSKVILRNRQQTFVCALQESILHAGLAAGINLNYGCDGGNCGDCKARLLSGQIKALRHSDYSFSQLEARQNYFLMCCNAAVGEVEIEALQRGRVDDIPLQRLQARVYHLEQLSPSVLSLALKTPRSQPLKFYAGQYLKLSFDTAHERNKSIASCPCDGLKPTFHINRVENDAFSNYAFNRLKKNDLVTLSGPSGRFVLDDDTRKPLVFIAFDSGFASINSLLEHAVNLEKEQAIEIFWITSQPEQAYLHNYCRALSDAFDNISYHSLSLLQSNFGEALTQISSLSRVLTQAQIYLSLPARQRDLAVQSLAQAGAQPENINFDSIERL